MILVLSILLSLSPRAEVQSPALHRALARATIAAVARDRQEARDMHRLAWTESRWTPGAVSSVGAAGLFQVMPRYHKTTARALQTRPVHSTLTAIGIWRSMVRMCGREGAYRCFSHGPYSRAGRAVRRAFNEARW